MILKAELAEEETEALPPVVLWVRRGAGVLALAALLITYGYPLEPAFQQGLFVLESLIVLLFASSAVYGYARAANRRAFLKRHLLDVFFLGLLIVAGAAFFFVPLHTGWGRVVLLLMHGYLLLRLLQTLVLAQERFIAHRVRPAAILIGGYVGLILFGTLMLMLPASRAPGARAWTAEEAFFTSVSAACVTGLSVRDVGSELSLRGQAIVLVLIQIGGLGLVTFALFVTYLRQRRLHLRQVMALREMLSLEAVGDLGRFLSYVLSITFLAEVTGAALLFWSCDEPQLSGGQRLWWAVFHSVSAFCNAGFALQADSFIRYAGAPVVNITLVALVVLGGLGFPVIQDLLNYRVSDSLLARRWLHRFGVLRDAPLSRPRLHTKLVLVATVLLLALSTLFIFVVERSHVLAGRPVSEQLLAALFQSAMPRTAGMNSIDCTLLQDATILVIIVLMAAGAAPISTGGGLKVSTVAVIVLTLRALLSGRQRVNAFQRSLPLTLVQFSIALFVLYAVAVHVIIVLLLLTQPQLSYRDVMFESVSALSTVGLSVGVTAQCDTLGRYILCGAMFLGRVGPLAILWSIVARPQALRYEYPEENVLVS